MGPSIFLLDFLENHPPPYSRYFMTAPLDYNLHSDKTEQQFIIDWRIIVVNDYNK